MRVDVCHRGQVLNGTIELLLINMKTNNDPTDVYSLAQAVYAWQNPPPAIERAMDLKAPMPHLAAALAQ